jgi:hypothetical protein
MKLGMIIRSWLAGGDKVAPIYELAVAARPVPEWGTAEPRGPPFDTPSAGL